MEYDIDVYLLSAKFALDYPKTEYPELMLKNGRPYSCLIIDMHEDYFICIPFRSHISHDNAYIFHETIRSRHTRSGLDYSKVVLIKDNDYIDSSRTVVVDQDEFTEAQRNMERIVSDITEYIDNYINHISGSTVLHPREFNRKYKFSTLKYFHDILKL
ncbi:MAG: hypothetical protein IJ192_01560 [Clostridia bacterium]|nr:hypothetical protein [Clostridia bacterium]